MQEQQRYNRNPFRRFLSQPPRMVSPPQSLLPPTAPPQKVFEHGGQVGEQGEIFHCFSISNVIGKQGETDIKNYLLQNGWASHIDDVSNDPTWQERDVDWLVLMRCKDGQSRWYRMEVKTDTYKKNMFFETESDRERLEVSKKGLGCMLVTEADLLCYYYINLNIAYIIQMPTYRKWVLENAHQNWVEEKGLTNVRWKNGRKEIYHSKGLVFDKRRFEDGMPRNTFRIYKNIRGATVSGEER